jgi:hypothetical protein
MEATRQQPRPWEDAVNHLWDTPVAEPDDRVTVDRALERPRPLRRRASRLTWAVNTGWLARVLAVAIGGLLLVGGISWLIDSARVRFDDLRYGRPRTTQLTGFVGHGDGDGIPTQLYAVNLNRRIVIIEIPGGDPNKLRAITGPYLVGRDEELTVATMRLIDVNDDGHADLLLRVRHEELVYINDSGQFRLMTRAERPVVERKLGGGQ